MSDMKSIFKYACHLPDQVAEFFLKRNAFVKIGTLQAEYAYSDEPFPFPKELNSIQVGTVWSPKQYGCGWFRFRGKVPKKGKGKHVVLLIDIGGEGCVYEGDTPVAGITDVSPVGKNFHLLHGKKVLQVAQCSTGEEEINIILEAGDNNEKKRAQFSQADICIFRQDVADLFYQYNNLSMLKPYFPFFSKQHVELEHRTEKARLLMPFCREKALEALQEKDGSSPYTVYATGHGHLDLAFLWPIRETRRKAIRTFTNQINLINRYDGYIYGVSQPQQLSWLQEDCPVLYEKVIDCLQSGRMEAQGGMWVESDTNIPCAESLIRQFMYGQRFWQEKIGRKVKTCWLPDCFGFSGNMPQILKKCGVDYFLTIKLSWNDTNKPQEHSFWWEGIDGSKVLTHIPPEHSYSGEGIPFTTLPALSIYKEKGVAPVYSMVFGAGDGGGGPSDGHIETILCHNRTRFLPTVKFASQESFFDRLSEDAEKLKTISGELYLEKHRGTYTSQSENKRYNRLMEILLHNVEALSVLAMEKGYSYPKEKLDRMWQEVLLYQFHDILPGSSVKRVYDECRERYRCLAEEGESLLRNALSYLSGENLVGCNLTPFPAETVLSSMGKNYRFKAPAYGVCKLLPYEKNTLVGDENVLENDFIRVTVDKNGDIISLFDKEKGECLSGKSRFVVYTEPEKADAWEVYRAKEEIAPPEILVARTKKFGREENGIYIQTEYRFGNSSMTMKVILREESRLCEIQTDVDWRENHRILRAEFTPSVWSEEVLCSVQDGFLSRRTTNENSAEEAQFEICGQEWICLSDGERTLSFLTFAKYGWRVKDRIVSLALLRSPVYPDPTCDRGRHDIKFAIYANKGTETVETEAQRQLFINPPLLFSGREETPFIACDNPHISVDTIKLGESGGIAVRMHECEGTRTSTRLTLPIGYTSLKETNLLEENAKAVEGNTIEFSPFEIKTFVLSTCP